jgi:hypothetical protein
MKPKDTHFYSIYLPNKAYDKLRELSNLQKVTMSTIIIEFLTGERREKRTYDTFGDKRGKMTRANALKGWETRRSKAHQEINRIKQEHGGRK